jgi:hypothetical protein
MKSNPFPVQLKLVKAVNKEEISEAFPPPAMVKKKRIPETVQEDSVLPAPPDGTRKARFFSSTIHPSGEESFEKVIPLLAMAALRAAPTVARLAVQHGPRVLAAMRGVGSVAAKTGANAAKVGVNAAKVGGKAAKMATKTPGRAAAAGAAAQEIAGEVAEQAVKPAAPAPEVAVPDMGTGEQGLNIALNPALTAGPKTRMGTSLPSPGM